MGNSAEKTNLGRKPWLTFAEYHSYLDTGDIVLLGARSPLGKATKFYQKNDYTNVGIVIKSSNSAEIFILEASVMRMSVFTTDDHPEIVCTGSVQTLRSKLFSGFYDIVAVRKIKWTKSRKILFGLDKPSELCKDEENPLTARLFDLAKEIATFQIHPKKYTALLQDFFESDYLKNAPPEELSILISAEYIAFILNKLGLFGPSFAKEVPKMRPMHFLSYTGFKLPWAIDKVEAFLKEVYIYLDYQVFEEDLIVREKLLPPMIYPNVQKESPLTFIRDLYDLEKFELSSGDLIFFEEVSEVALTMQKLYGVEYTRMAMVVCIPGVDIPFVYDIPPLFMALFEMKKVKTKLLEGRMISLDSYLSSGIFKKVMIRKLFKKAVETNPNNPNGVLHDSDISRMKSIFTPQGTQEKDGDIEEIRQMGELKKKNSIMKGGYTSFKDIKNMKLPGGNKKAPENPDEKPENPNKIYAYVDFKKETDIDWIHLRDFYFEFAKEKDFGVLSVDVSSIYSSHIVIQAYTGLGLITDLRGWGIKKFQVEEKLQRDYFLGPQIEVNPIDIISRLQSFHPGKKGGRRDVAKEKPKETAPEVIVEMKNEDVVQDPGPEGVISSPREPIMVDANPISSPKVHVVDMDVSSPVPEAIENNTDSFAIPVHYEVSSPTLEIDSNDPDLMYIPPEPPGDE